MPPPREPHFEQFGPARDAQSRAGPPGARALFDGDGNFVCWQPPRSCLGAERRASDRARGGADYYGNDEHEGDDEDEFYVPQTQAAF